MTEGSKTDKELQLRDSMEMEGVSGKRLPYPKGCFFIMATELSERFSYYGMRAVLTIYMRNELNFSENTATSYYHIFLMLCYGLPVVWGVLSDSWLGKYRTIFYVSILFAIGNVTLTLSSIPPLKLPVEAFFFVGLFLMAVGTAGMKPCVAPLGGEQFILPQQENQLKQFFSLFFFAITIGNMISTVITPVFRRDVSCFGMENCYPLAFGVPSTIMLLAIVVFVSGRRLYVINTPNGNMMVKVVKCMSYAISNRGKKSASVSPSPSTHWLDSAADKYDESLIADTKGLLRVLVYYLPVPMFFALYEQLGSRWTLQVSNAILMFIFLPFFQYVIYPIFGKCGVCKKPLQKMVIGGVLAALSFAVAGIVETKIEPAVRSEPASGLTVLNFANNVPCPIDIWLNSSASAQESDYTVNINDVVTLPPMNFKNRQILARTASENCSGSNLGLDIQWLGILDVAPTAYQTASISVTSNNSLSVSPLPFEDDFAKSKDGNARVRFAVSRDSSSFKFKADEGVMKVTLTPVKGNGETKSFLLLRAEDNIVFSNTEEVSEDTYTVTLQTNTGNIRLTTVYEFLNGGSYVLVMHDDLQSAGQIKSQLVIVTPANNIHILWLLPQYVLMAWGEILFIVSGMEFSFTEAPASMKSVLQAIWHLMNACGNVIVIIAAMFHGHSPHSQGTEFFTFAGLMMADSIVFAFMAWRYKYVSSGETPVIAH
ncbi:Solute carrier family 15 member 2 [Orchesella cincta]|uniref:Solute carrier family 15 member 2 n=1 Tax=Orchesella cincta TaxID=48709 RepID=A0A1D2N662_ORCCI|nr:Solute carrier family 15 member 2 [Orchesella cincta]